MTRRDQVIGLIEELRDAIDNNEIDIGEDLGFSQTQVVSALDDVLLELEGKYPFEK